MHTPFLLAAQRIADTLRFGAESGYADTQNTFGEQQLALDITADTLLEDALTADGRFAAFSSEERAELVPLSETGEYAAVFDPLDGSSLVDANFAIGTVYGIYPGNTLLSRTPRDMIGAGYIVYGPKTLAITADASGVTQRTLGADRQWSAPTPVSPLTTKKVFAPGNLRATEDNPAYEKLIEHYRAHGYTLRYSGGMVPDVHHIVAKGGGIFLYPGSPQHPAKLRLLYEAGPLAYIVERIGGGSSSDGTGSILDQLITSYDQRTVVVLGETAEVARCTALV